MPRLTADQVKALAPDPASLRSGQGLVDPRHWPRLGADEAALWGECKGSGQEPYKVRVDLSNMGYACTCPSHKYPCKHVIALMLFSATAPAKLKEKKAPAWVTEWLEKREVRKAKAEKPVRAKTETAETIQARQKDASRRAARREKLAEGGVDALELWLKDFARRGLASAQSVPAGFWEEQAARLVDAQLPGAARLIREMSDLPGSRPDWGEVLLLRMARLHLLIQAYRRLETLPEEARQDVRYLLGWTVNQDELLASGSGVSDDWLVAASRTEEDEQTGLRTQVNWLWGRQTKRPAQVLNFAFRSQPLDASLVPGLVLRGELVFFPSAYPLRAVFRHKQVAEPSFTPGGYTGVTQLLDEYSTALGRNPWLEVWPAVLEGSTPLHTETTWTLRDGQGCALPLSAQFPSAWELFALAGGRPLVLFGTWDGGAFRPLAAWADERYVAL